MHPTRTALLALTLAACTTAEPAPQEFRACEGHEFTITEPNPKLVWTPNAIRLTSEQLAPGVFAIYDDNSAEHGPAGVPLATSGGFVIGDDSVLLVESMINRQLFCQAVELVKAQTDRPIRYVVNTSSHGDHTFGNAFLPDDVEVVQHARTAEFIAANFVEDVEFMKANFGEDQGLDEITPVAADIRVGDEGWSVDLGGKTVEARYYGFAQTPGDLFVWVPDAKVLWTGNAFVAEEPALPWLLAGQGEAAEVTLHAVQDALPSGSIVVPGHGRPLAPAGMNFYLDYLGAMIAGVRAAVEGGLTLEQTVAAVTLEEYQGYGLWGWIHQQVNVPNTYGELAE
jgi:glyoxylase-like metal-dependent hydrolase (beta-lactamase superfamily II)